MSRTPQRMHCRRDSLGAVSAMGRPRPRRDDEFAAWEARQRRAGNQPRCWERGNQSEHRRLLTLGRLPPKIAQDWPVGIAEACSRTRWRASGAVPCILGDWPAVANEWYSITQAATPSNAAEAVGTARSRFLEWEPRGLPVSDRPFSKWIASDAGV